MVALAGRAWAWRAFGESLSPWSIVAFGFRASGVPAGFGGAGGAVGVFGDPGSTGRAGELRSRARWPGPHIAFYAVRYRHCRIRAF